MSAAASSMRLEVISGNAAGTTITVEDELVIGRHASGAGRLSEDVELSRQHARVSREVTGDYAIEDLGSSNGTFVNGLRIQSPRLLSLGDSIETGATTLVVREIVQPEPVESSSNPPEPPSPVLSVPTVSGRSPVAQPAAMPSPAPVEPASQTPPSPSPSQRTSQTPPLAIKLEVDFDAREARISLGDGEDTIYLVLEDGNWRASTATTDPGR